jgi:hypothetical protein
MPLFNRSLFLRSFPGVKLRPDYVTYPVAVVLSLHITVYPEPDSQDAFVEIG